MGRQQHGRRSRSQGSGVRFETVESRLLFATVDVASFGAIPGDGANDTAAIQAAINASSPGDTVQFRAGQYDISSLQIRTARNYIGAPDTATTIRSSGAEYAFYLDGNARDITISGLRFEKAGIVMAGGSAYRNVRILGNEFDDMATNAVKATIYTDGLIINGNTFRNVRGYGAILLYGTDRLSYSYNRLIDCKHGGHILGPLNDNQIVRNYMTGIEVMGIEIQRNANNTSVSQNLLVEGNVVYDWRTPNGASFGLSVIAEGGYNTIIRNNYLRNSIAPGSAWNADLRGQGYTFGPGIEAGFETGIIEGNVLGGPNRWTVHIGCAGINLHTRNNKMFGRTDYGPYVSGWPSIHGYGTFVEAGNLKDPTNANMPPAPPMHGDANADGVVNLADFTVLATNMGRTGALPSQGDLNGDGAVNLVDYNILVMNLGRKTW